MKYFFGSWWELETITEKEIQKEEISGRKERRGQGWRRRGAEHKDLEGEHVLLSNTDRKNALSR